MLLSKERGNIIIDFNPEKKTVDSFFLVDQYLTDPETMMGYLTEVFALAVHSAIHYHNDRFYRENRGKAGKKYDKIFQYGQSLNENSYFWPAFTMAFGSARSTFKNTLSQNGLFLQPKSHPTGAHMKLMKYSRTGRYLMSARAILFRLVRQHQVDINAELFFVTSIIHSIDHYMFNKIAGSVYHKNPGKPWVNITFHFWIHPIPHYLQIISGSLLWHHKADNEFYMDLYTKLSRLDQELTDQVTLSISS